MRLLDDFSKNVGFVFLTFMVVNVCNYLFHIFMSRSVGPVDDGILASLFSLFMIISVPAESLQMVMAKYVSSFKAYQKFGKTGLLLRRWLRSISLWAALVFILLLFSSGYLSFFLHLPSRLPLIIIGVALVLAIISRVTVGVLQGLQKFGYFGIDIMTGGIGKLIFAVLLVYLGLKVVGATLGLALGYLSALLLALFLLRSLLSKGQDAGDRSLKLERVGAYFLAAALTSLCYIVLINVDILLVKHFFNPSQAGHYAAASILAKIIFYLPGGIIMVMFPTASELYALKEESQAVLKKSLFYGGVLCSSVVLLYFVLPSFVVKTLFGKEYIAAVPLMGTFGLAMFFFVLANILSVYQLSVSKLKFLKILVVATILEITLVSIFHNTLAQVIFILLGISLFLFVFNIWYVFFDKDFRVKGKFS